MANPATQTQLQTDPDYSQFAFEAERFNFHTVFKTEFSWLQSRNKTERTISLSSVTVNLDGSITIGNTNYSVTKWAFEKFCSVLGIPRPFARKIPPDLLLDNIRRLIAERTAGVDDMVMFHFANVNSNEVIFGCTKEDYLFVSAIDFLTALAAMDGTGYQLQDLLVSDRLVEADLLVENTVLTTPTTRSQFSVGINLRSSDVGDVNPTARLMLKDDDNDVTFVLGTEWGRVDRIRNKKVSIQTSFVNFMGHVREMIIPIQQLENSLEKLDQEEATDVELKNWYDTFNRAVQNKEMIDEKLLWAEVQRKELFKQISIRRKSNNLNRLQGLPLQKDLSSGFKKRDLSKIVSEYANSSIFDEREPLRRLGGSFVTLG